MLRKKFLIPYLRYIAHVFMNRGGKYKFEGLHPLKKFGQFAEIEDVDVGEVAETPNVMIEEEHDVQVLGSKSSDDDAYVVQPLEYEDVVTGHKPDMDFDFESDMEPFEIESSEQMNLLTAENLDALLEHVKRSVGNPPPTSSFTDQESPLDTAADLIPRKRRRRDPRPGIVVREPETEITPEIQLPSIMVEDVDYDSFLIGETGAIADKGMNVLPDEEPIDVLQDKFKGEFLDESGSSTAVEPEPEMSRAEFDELNRSREEGLRKYFSGETGFEVSMAKSREVMMITERTIQEARDATKIKPTRKLTKQIEYFDHPYSFKSLTVVDMVELARQRFFNPTKNKRGESFYTSLQQHVRKGFSDMTLGKSVRIKKTTNSLGNPIDIDVFEVRWPAIDWMKKVPILPDLPDGVLDNFKFWAFDDKHME
ncbi:hypothetical protein R6Q57_009084 [Mikania cordata]